MKKTFGTKVFAVLAALAVLLTFALSKAACAQSVYPDTGDFELRCVYGNMPLENMRFSVYRVADMPSLGKFSLLPAFEESGADIENIEKASDWNRVAKELAEFAKNMSVTPLETVMTDTNGTFRLTSLDRGLYLFVGETLRVDETEYSCSPFLVSLPDFDENSGKWIFNVTAEAKIGSSPVEPEPTTPTTGKKPNTEDPNDLAEWIFPLVAASIGFVTVLCLFIVITKRGKEQN